MEEDEEKEKKVRDEFLGLVNEAKAKVKDEKYQEGLLLYQKAMEVHHSKKLEKRIEKLKAFLEELEDDEDEDDDYDDYVVFDGYKIYKKIWEKLFPYQREGVKWMWGLHRNKRGGILGDDMGLGKTIQIIAFLSGMFDAGLVEHIIIVMPVSCLETWKKQFEDWVPGIPVGQFHGVKSKREKELRKIQENQGVILTSYGTIISNCEILGTSKGGRFVWDYIILDEGQKIKNPTKTSKAARLIPAKSHFILSGTPIQNNLLMVKSDTSTQIVEDYCNDPEKETSNYELWALIDFITEGKLLGTSKIFKSEFENPIVRARERDATDYERKVGNKISETLRKMIAPYFLRRTKKEVLGVKEEIDESDNVDEETKVFEKLSLENQKMTKKHDLIIWLFLTDLQLNIYKDFLKLDNIREVMNSTRSPLAALTMLKKIADHPRLLSNVACDHLGLSGDLEQNEDILLEESSKLQFVLELMKDLIKHGHRTLIFSQSRKMLDIVDKIFTKENIKLIRLDGRIIDTSERQKIITIFNTDQSYSCCLLTTQVGSVGLNLTGADRVIIFDPSWNPGSDAQAVDRAYRIGQRKDVVIYRLITCGTIEEKIYRKQIFKMSVSNQTTGTTKNPYRYFKRNELKELFILENPKESITYGLLNELRGRQTVNSTMESHFKFLKSLDIYGISDHGLVDSREAANVDCGDTEYDSQIVERVKRAEEMVTSEANICAQMADLSLLSVMKSNKKPKGQAESTTKIPISIDSPEVIKISESPITNHSIRIPDSPDAGISDIRRRISHAVARNSCNDPCMVEDSPDPNEAVKSRSSFQNGVVVTTPLLFEEDQPTKDDADYGISPFHGNNAQSSTADVILSHNTSDKIVALSNTNLEDDRAVDVGDGSVNVSRGNEKQSRVLVENSPAHAAPSSPVLVQDERFVDSSNRNGLETSMSHEDVNKSISNVSESPFRQSDAEFAPGSPVSIQDERFVNSCDRNDIENSMSYRDVDESISCITGTPYNDDHTEFVPDSPVCSKDDELENFAAYDDVEIIPETARLDRSVSVLSNRNGMNDLSYVEVADTACSPIRFEDTSTDAQNDSESPLPNKASEKSDSSFASRDEMEEQVEDSDHAVPESEGFDMNPLPMNDSRMDCMSINDSNVCPESINDSNVRSKSVNDCSYFEVADVGCSPFAPTGIDGNNSANFTSPWRNNTALPNGNTSADSNSRRSFHWSAARELERGTKAKSSYGSFNSASRSNGGDGSILLFSNSESSTVPVPAEREAFSELSAMSSSFIQDPLVQLADTVLIERDSDSFRPVPLERTNAMGYRNPAVDLPVAGIEEMCPDTRLKPGIARPVLPEQEKTEGDDDTFYDSDPDFDYDRDYSEDDEIVIKHQSASYPMDDSDDSDDDVLLLRSRRSLRNSILLKPKSSPLTSVQFLSESLISCEEIGGSDPSSDLDQYRLSFDRHEADTLQISDPGSQQDPSSVCPCGKHDPASGIKIKACECTLNADERSRYQDLVDVAESLVESENEFAALKCYEEALSIADADLKVVKKSSLIGGRIAKEIV